MSTSALVMMVVMLSAFWGGFGALLYLSLRRVTRSVGRDSDPDDR